MDIFQDAVWLSYLFFGHERGCCCHSPIRFVLELLSGMKWQTIITLLEYMEMVCPMKNIHMHANVFISHDIKLSVT